MAAILALAVLAALPAEARKNRSHTVKQGDSLAEIARFHGVDIEVLRQVNDLEKDEHIHPGDVLAIPDVLVDGWTRGHVVKQGDTVARVARRYRVSRDELTRTNRIRDGRLKIGQRLAIPKGKRVDPGAVGVDGDPSKAKAVWDGKLTALRPRDSERATMTVFDSRGRVRTYAQRTLSRLARSKKGRVRQLHPRLVQLLGKVAERYPGSAVEIISGYRPHKRGRSRSQHSKGRAVDFRVRGVGNLELYNFLRTFPKVGVGYYPNSTFVHLDVRDRKYVWTDLSEPGEPARYVKPGEPGSAEQTAETTASGEGEPDPENFSDEEEGTAAEE
jgi:uncharacterized protein YcbK (DUF882 family)